MRTNLVSVLLAAALVGGTLLAPDAMAQRKTAEDRSTRESQGDYAAYKLLKRAEELLEVGEKDRGVKMFETVIEQHPRSAIRFKAYLALGKFHLEERQQALAIDFLRNLERIQNGKQEMTEDQEEMYLEGLYLTGMAHFQLRQYGAAFSVLRKITNNYPDSNWANQAYYYIGMSHFAQAHWDKAIKALAQVGTFIDADSPTLAYAEAGHRLHVRVTDGDIPVLKRLGRDIAVSVTTTSGDKETIQCKPMSNKKDVYVGSILTRTGEGEVGDDVLQVVGGDRLTVQYLDDNTKEGDKDVPREKTVEVVSTGGVTFTLGTYESLAPAAYLGQPLFMRLWDLDLDKTVAKDTATLRIASMYKPEEEEEDLEGDLPATTVDVEKLLEEGELEEEEEERLVVRDEVVITVSEQGEAPFRTGIFTGTVPVERSVAGLEIDKTDQTLTADIADEIVATYVDELHILGRTPIEITAKLTVAGEIDSSPRASQNVVPDALVKARKDLIEGEAYLELARIFKDMGLADGAKSKATDGLSRVEEVIRTRAEIPNTLKETAFRLKWELHLAEDEFGKAMATCNTFNRIFPESALVDQALMGIADVLYEKEDYRGAINVWRQVTRLPNSHANAKAQFKIAETTELHSKNKNSAVQEYMACAQRYPDSEYAGPALGKVVNYHVASGAYDVADDLLQQVFIDYQDEDFLDEMLLRWVELSARSGDYVKAKEKYMRLISEYPGSESAQKAEAQDILAKIERRLEMQKEKKNDE